MKRYNDRNKQKVNQFINSDAAHLSIPDSRVGILQ